MKSWAIIFVVSVLLLGVVSGFIFLSTFEMGWHKEEVLEVKKEDSLYWVRTNESWYFTKNKPHLKKHQICVLESRKPGLTFGLELKDYVCRK